MFFTSCKTRLTRAPFSPTILVGLRSPTGGLGASFWSLSLPRTEAPPNLPGFSPLGPYQQTGIKNAGVVL